jgi:hypothetical protein
MSAEPCTTAGQVPRTQKSLQVWRPWLIGTEPRTIVFSPGLVGQVSLSAIAPAVLVIARFCGASVGNYG